MKTTLFLFLLALTLGLASCKKEETKAGDIKNVPLTTKQQQLVDQSNAFGFNLFRKAAEISGTGKNMMLSPLSISMALGMTRNGAANATLDSMTTTLGFNGLTDQEINESYKYILETFSTLDPKVDLSIANSIWSRNTFSVIEAFKATNQTYFNASVTPLDFNDPSSVTTINNWVSDNTNDLIPKIVDQIGPDMVMYLINAVYFKGQWRYQFEKEKTAPKTFYLADNSQVQVESMLQRANLQYFKGSVFQAVELPYNQGNYNMNILLPDAGTSLADVIALLTQENWQSWKQGFVETDVQLQIPKFKYEYEEKNMIPILAGLGMGIAFAPDFADFTRINSEGGLYISEVKQKTYIETNEEGTEAAAVTSVGVAVTTIGIDPQPVSFIADHPFVYLITEKSTGTILFIGTVMNPAL
ncbi:MAG TPA: serpin family protein [Bacteroidales bacterium]|nr:serpin family protein [Bacteroidales bacterium]